MKNQADVIIVGAGIVGLSIAHQILRRSSLDVLVLEKGAGLGEGSTGASSAVCRFRYSNDEMVLLARDGVAAYRNWSEFLGLTSPAGTYHRQGNLWFTPYGRSWAEPEAARLMRLGVSASVLDDTALASRFPLMSRCIRSPDLETGADHCCEGGGVHLLEEDAGYMDPMAAAADLLEAVRARGGKVQFGCKATQVQSEGGRATGVLLKDGTTLCAGVVVNAAGPWCDDLFKDLGLATWPLAPTRIQIVHIDCPSAYHNQLPICADLTSGIYFREQLGSQQIIVGSVLEADEQDKIGDPDLFDRGVDQQFVAAKLHALSHRFPALPIRGVKGYSGLYTINETDVHPIVGETALSGFYAANGCSGHGFKLAPSIGSLIARSITGNQDHFDTFADPGFLSVNRAPISVQTKSALA
ncbi:NAD(P)/FAD-dependent oxidoreductase [Sphingomonas sp. RB1R13]|uniref:NAD(P)/FAD-dependent oxidoreductase n=1 Tax=Sphingomonas sp. RB1R13 TaxID=3096159 RepID=UPI002FC66E92